MFRVEWSPKAEAELFAAWQSTANRFSLLASVQAAGAALSLQPLAVGESRDDDTLRVCFFHPVTIYFAVSPEENLVRIVHCVALAD